MSERKDYDKGYVNVSHFLPGGMIVEDGHVRSLAEADFHAYFEDEPVQMLYTMPIKPTYTHCQKCGCENHDDGFIAVFENFLMMPCWECETIVILRRERAEAQIPSWEDELI